ncbi:MAG: GGDEF domain-containing protein [Xanthomonadales bacterium]|nr:GGDEF domain-containing protein [Xanthomonadales bacterium]
MPLAVSWLIDGKTAAGGWEALDPGVEIGVRARLLSFVGEHRIRYRFRLLDEASGAVVEDSGLVASGDVSYRRLAPGRYRLEVEARAADGGPHGPAVAALRDARPVVAAAVGGGRGRARAGRARLAERAGARRLPPAPGARARAVPWPSAPRRSRGPTPSSTASRGWTRSPASAIAARSPRSSARRRPAGATLVVIIDIDRFKAINDRFGHRTGDEVLAELARRLRAVCRQSDEVLRYGGEEFVLVAREAPGPAAGSLLGRLLAAVGDRPFRVSGAPEPLRVTISAGAARIGDAEPADFAACLALADEALYAAKEHGRDQAWLVDAEGEAVLRSGRRARVLRRPGAPPLADCGTGQPLRLMPKAFRSAAQAPVAVEDPLHRAP